MSIGSTGILKNGSRCLYKLSGDKLKVCYDMTGRQYPKNFDAGKGSGRMSYEFTREKIEQHAGE